MRGRYRRRALTGAPLLCLAFVIAISPLHAQGGPEGECTGAALDRRSPSLPSACTALINNPKAIRKLRVQAHFLRGIWNDWQGRTREALSDFEAGLKLDPEHPRLNRNLAIIVFKMGDLARAKALITKAVELDPKDAAGFVALSNFLSFTSDTRGVVAALDRALDIQPGHVIARLRRAEWLTALGRSETALADTAWLVSQPPASLVADAPVDYQGVPTDALTLAYVTHAMALQRSGRTAEATQFIDRLVAERPSAVAYAARAQFFIVRPLAAGQVAPWQDALAAADKAIALDPQIGFAHGRRAVALQLLGRHGEALASVDQALVRSPGGQHVPELLWERARILRSLKRSPEAAQSAKMAVGYALRGNRAVLSMVVSNLKQRGYWVSSDIPNQVTEDVADALTACMLDTACG